MLNEFEVVAVVNETSDCSSITLRVPESRRADFMYYPGQYLTFELNVGSEKLKRSYSISSCPYTEKDITVAVKRVKGGLVSNYINDNVKVGDKLKVDGPDGNFKIKAGGFFSFRSYVFFAGGSGITPIISMIKAVLAKERFSKVTLFYANRDTCSIIYNSRLSELGELYGKRFTVKYILQNPPVEWNGESGMLDRNICSSLLTKSGLSVQKSSYYICGPRPMMDIVISSLRSLGVPDSKINLEYFSGSKSASASVAVSEESDDKSVRKVTAVVDGKERQFELQYNQNVLEGALKADLDVAYSCREGICSSCKGQVLSGEVRMAESHGLTDSEKEKGYILTCQSYVVTPELKVKFCN
jgi:ring-1,2-phenylacetyl-CoA epoxidase subunit PaaE